VKGFNKPGVTNRRSVAVFFSYNQQGAWRLLEFQSTHDRYLTNYESRMKDDFFERPCFRCNRNWAFFLSANCEDFNKRLGLTQLILVPLSVTDNRWYAESKGMDGGDT